jgi:predicted outer membrane protein
MNPIDAISLTTAGLAPSAQPQAQTAPREVSSERADTFRDLVSKETTASNKPEHIDLDIEKVLMANMPAANASPAEFAMGMLRAQVKVAQAAIAIEMVNKTTQSLSQGVQSLANRS